MEWIPVEEFPRYAVSPEGGVINLETGYILNPTPNTNGLAQVGFSRNGVLYKRSVALLVAKAFLDPHPNEQFRSPINLNGDRMDNCVENLMWRPRWFSVIYHRQFLSDPQGFRTPVIDVKTEEVFRTSWDAATKYGLIDEEIKLATLNRTYVWPTYQQFRVL